MSTAKLKRDLETVRRALNVTPKRYLSLTLSNKLIVDWSALNVVEKGLEKSTVLVEVNP